MNVYTKAIDTIKYTVPKAILQLAFKDDLVNWRQAPVSIDHQILEKVIKPRVLVDLNLVGGQTVIINLDGTPAKYTDTHNIVYEISPALTSNREIISILSVSYLPYSSSFNSLGYGMGTINPTSMSDLMSATQRVADSHSNIPPVSNATADLVGYNTVLIRDQHRVTNAYQIRCVLANAENLSNINPRSYLHIAKLCELAVKSYIYNKMIIDMDYTHLVGGQELGKVKEIVESYSDHEQMYQDYLKQVVQKVMFMNDHFTHARFIKMQVNPTI